MVSYYYFIGLYMDTLTEKELKELDSKYNISYFTYGGEGNPTMLHKFSNGKVVNGYLSERNTMVITSVTQFLCE